MVVWLNTPQSGVIVLQDAGSRMKDLGFLIQGPGSRILGPGFRILDPGPSNLIQDPRSGILVNLMKL